MQVFFETEKGRERAGLCGAGGTFVAWSFWGLRRWGRLIFNHDDRHLPKRLLQLSCIKGGGQDARTKPPWLMTLNTRCCFQPPQKDIIADRPRHSLAPHGQWSPVYPALETRL
jgi:hypothetical protein